MLIVRVFCTAIKPAENYYSRSKQDHLQYRVSDWHAAVNRTL
jgi:hypothetical protein